MRWKINYKEKLKEKKYFAWFPIYLRDEDEWVWLEYVIRYGSIIGRDPEGSMVWVWQYKKVSS